MLDATRRQPSGEDPVNAVRTVKSSAATPEKLVPETSRMTPSSGFGPLRTFFGANMVSFGDENVGIAWGGWVFNNKHIKKGYDDVF